MKKVIRGIFCCTESEDESELNEKTLAQILAYDEGNVNYEWAEDVGVAFSDYNATKPTHIVDFHQVPFDALEPSFLDEYKVYPLSKHDKRKWFVYIAPIIKTKDVAAEASKLTNPWYFIYSANTLKEAIEKYQTQGSKYEKLEWDFGLCSRALQEILVKTLMSTGESIAESN